MLKKKWDYKLREGIFIITIGLISEIVWLAYTI